MERLGYYNYNIKHRGQNIFHMTFPVSHVSKHLPSKYRDERTRFSYSTKETEVFVRIAGDIKRHGEIALNGKQITNISLVVCTFHGLYLSKRYAITFQFCS